MTPRHDPMGPALTRPSRYISRQASCRLAPSDETVRDTYRLHGAPARSVPSRGPIGGLGGYVVTVWLCGGSPGPQRCGTNQYIGADHATKQGHQGRRSVAPVGPIRLQLALEVVYIYRRRQPRSRRTLAQDSGRYRPLLEEPLVCPWSARREACHGVKKIVGMNYHPIDHFDPPRLQWKCSPGTTW